MRSVSKARRGLALGATIAAVGTTSALAFTGTPGTGGAPVTDRPDLVSVTLEADNAINDRQAAQFCFDEQLQTTFGPGRFFIQTYDSDRLLINTSAVINPDDGKCVVVEFNPSINLKEQGSVGNIEGGAVRNLANRPNYSSNAPITGSTLAQTAGRSTGPDLIAATPRQTDATVNFTFDQEVNPGAIVPNAFAVVADNGVETLGTAVVQVDNATEKSVRIQFPGDTNVQGAIRYSVQRGAVRTRAQDSFQNDAGNPGDADALFTLGTPGAVGTAASSRPVLEGAAPRVDGSSQFVLDYSDDLGNYTPALVLAIMDNGQVEAANGAQQVQGQTDKKILSWPAGGIVDSEPSAVVAIVSQTGAATTANGNQPAPISAVAVGPGAPMRPGYTTAPDLLTTNIDDTADQAGFTYDEEVDVATIGGPGLFQLLIPNGDPIAGNAIAGTANEDKTVIVSYAGDVKAAVGVANFNGAVEDNEANDAIFGAVSTTLIPLPDVGTPSAVPTTTAFPTASPTASPTQGPDTSRVRVRGKVRGIKSPGRRIKGRIRAARGCAGNRRVVVKKGRKTVGSGRTKSNGRFNIKTRKHKKGKLTVKVRQRSNSSTVCRAISKKVPGRN